MKPYVLIVEDEEPIVTLLRDNLEQADFEVASAPDGQEALRMIGERKPEMILLDGMLPSVSGLEVCRQIRRRSDTRNTPIIILTDSSEADDHIRALDSGADDCITKPFSPAEVVARIRAAMRRMRPSLPEDSVAYEDVVMDLAAHRVSRAGRPIHLGPTEFRLLRYFMEHPGRVFSREQLLDAVWGHDVYVDPRTVDVHIRRLRVALNGEAGKDIIRTVRSAGYALDAGVG